MSKRRKNQPIESLLHVGDLSFRPSTLNDDGSTRSRARIDLRLTHRQADPGELLAFLGSEEAGWVLACTIAENPIGPGGVADGADHWHGHVRVTSIKCSPPSSDRSSESGDDTFARVHLAIATVSSSHEELVGLFGFRCALDRAEATAVHVRLEPHQRVLDFESPAGTEE